MICKAQVMFLKVYSCFCKIPGHTRFYTLLSIPCCRFLDILVCTRSRTPSCRSPQKSSCTLQCTPCGIRLGKHLRRPAQTWFVEHSLVQFFTFATVVSQLGWTCSVQMISHFLGSLLNSFLKPLRSFDPSQMRRTDRSSRTNFMMLNF